MRGSSVPKLVLVVLALTLPLAGISGCGQTPPRGGQLTGVTWRATSYFAVSGMNDVPPGVAATAEFADNAVSGQLLNSYSGPFTTDDKGNVTKAGPFASTKKSGSQEIMNFESDYLSDLGNAASYYSTGTQLTLYDDKDEVILIYEKTNATVFGNWGVISYNNGKDAVVSVIANSRLTAVFSAKGEISGFGGVNQFSGIYSLEGVNSISIGPLDSTGKSGPPDLVDQEKAYLEALKSAATYSVAGNSLELRDGKGAIAAQFKRLK